MSWSATAGDGRLEIELERGTPMVTIEDLLGAAPTEPRLGSFSLDLDDELTAEDQLDELMDALGVSEPEARPALRPRPEPSEGVLIALAAALVAVNVTLWTSTAAVAAAALLALP